ncbi:hypothetical protein [Actinomadura rubrisoli]|uniref:NUDIX domain-containing protein n=1 Tax=Actinomadura rubrisoli TaxID=2530368 RepID=A0A4R5AVX6_9ACTN|nr:hypothetical protein [Actinomadura rubrisoli]TDD74772.1 hypothetical protein E1298_32220 [Actinomadura rubrisoli]
MRLPVGRQREPGGVDAGALVREIREEVAVALVPDMIVHLGTWEAHPDGGHPDGVTARMT